MIGFHLPFCPHSTPYALIPQQILLFTEACFYLLFLNKVLEFYVSIYPQNCEFFQANFCCFSFGTCAARWVGQLRQEWEEKFLSSVGSQPFSQLSNVWASARSVSHETPPWKGVLHEAYVPQEWVSKLRDALPNAVYAHQIKTQQLKGHNSNSRPRKPTEGI